MSSESPRQAGLPTSRRRARRRRTLKRILLGLGFVLLVGLGVVAFQGWQIVDAIFHAEKAAVVPLPTRSSGVELGGATGNTDGRPAIIRISQDDLTATAEARATMTPDQVAPVSPTPSMPNLTVSPTATSQTIVPVATSSPTIEATAQPTGTTPAGEPTSTGVPTEQITTPEATQPPAGQEIASAEPTPTSTVGTEPTLTATVPPEPTAEVAQVNPTVASSDDGPSRFDVFQQVVGAGLDDGDPGLNDVWQGAETLNILVVGVDRRPDGGDQNSDVIIIAQLDLVDKEVRAVSIPRDLLVEIPGIGFDKINSAYNYGVQADPENPAAGVSTLRDTVEYNFGIPIDHYVMIDFDGFVDVVDSVGGIDVLVPADLYDPEYPTTDYGVEEIFFPAGMNEMDGETALKYVRTRHQDSDDGRRQRQLDVILAIFEKGKSLGSINNIDDLIFALGDSAQTSFGLEQQLVLARLALQIDEANISLQSLAPPLIWSGTIEATGAWVYTGDWGPIVEFVQTAVLGDEDGQDQPGTSLPSSVDGASG
jgi:LCP family protein required for cell wall assembly